LGHIKKLLSGKTIPKRSMTPCSIWTDLCENIHLHYRNLRLEFSETEWAHFRAAINHLGKAVERCSVENGYEEGDPNFLIQQVYNFSLKPDSDYYKNRSTIELQRDDTVHFHYRDLRLHWSKREFVEIANMFVDAVGKFNAVEPFRYADVKERTKVLCNIEDIQPYDEGHRPLAIDEEHRSGIEFIKSEIKNGVKIRPILVNTEGQRLDGFKRYMAFLELGFEEIWCFVDPFGIMGGQSNQSHIADEDNDAE